MRPIFYILPSLAVIFFAYWAYNENYQTQASLKKVSQLQRQIESEKRAIATLKAEWAYLNRPERLRDLVELNFDDLQLLPLTGAHFGALEWVGFPAPDVPQVSEITDLSAQSEGQDE